VAIKPLLAAMKDSSPRVRSNAASALAGFGPAAKEGVPALTTALDDKDSGMRAGAALTLGRIGPEAKAATPKLIELLRAEPKAGEPKNLFEDVVRRNAAMALGRITRGTDVAVAPLIAALDDKGLEVGVYAAIALGEIGPAAKGAVGPLQGFIQTEKDARIRIHAAAALMRIDPQLEKSSMQVLVAALTDERMFVRHNALTALEGLGPLAKEAMPALQKILQDPDKAIQDGAARALKKIDAEAAKKAGVK
jgi:HEAT repeat protein